METKTTQTFDLSDDDVKQAITDFIEKKYGKGKPLTVTMGTTKYSGFGMSERPDYVPVISAKREC